jgi:hypothetical protein
MATDNTFDFFNDITSLDTESTKIEKIPKKRKTKTQEIEKIEENIEIKPVEKIVKPEIQKEVEEITAGTDIVENKLEQEAKIEEINTIEITEEKNIDEEIIENKLERTSNIDDEISKQIKIKIPERKKICPNAIRQTYHINSELAEKIKVYAYIARLGISEVVNDAIEQYLKDKDLNL